MKKYIKKNKYTPQNGDRIVGYTYFPRTRMILSFLRKHWFLIAVILLSSYMYMIWDNNEEELTKEQIDTKIQEKYEEIYKERYEFDKLTIEEEETEKMHTIVSKRLEEKISSYWKEAKEDILKGVAEYVEASPEVTELLVDMPEAKDLEFTAQNTYHDLQSYLQANYPDSPMIGVDVISICKEANITAWQCRLGLAIIKHESRYGTAYAGDRPDLGLSYNNYGGVKCDSRLAKLKPCKFPDENGMYLTKFNSPESFLRYFFGQIIGKNWGACSTTACMSPKYVAPSGERNFNWENKINGEILNLHFTNY